MLEAQWPAVRNNTSTSSAAHITSSSLFTIDNVTANPLATLETGSNNTRGRLTRMPQCILHLFCDLLDSPDVANLSEAMQLPWIIGHVVRRRELLDAILNGRQDQIRLYFLDAKEKYRSKSLIRWGLEKPSLTALWALMAFGAALWPEDVKFAATSEPVSPTGPAGNCKL
jgi:hypothetical protein